MLQQHKLITKWRSAFLEVGDMLHSSKQPNRELIAIQQSHLEKALLYSPKSYFNQLYNNQNFKLVSSEIVQCQNYSTQSGRPNFFSQFIENIKQEMAKNKEMKENLRKFREERTKLEQSEALKKARAKYMTLENEASAKFKENFEKVKGSVSGVLEEAGKSEIAKKAGKISEDLVKSAKDAAETISAKGLKIGATETFKTISEATAAVRNELDQSGPQARVYVAPTKLRKRQELPENGGKIFEANTTTMDVELHKDSRFYESWVNFKNNNPYFNKVLDWKIKYEESENPMIRFSRFFTDKVSYVVGGIFQNTELSNALTEVVKLDPSFTKASFLRQCEADIIPNILEAIARGDLDILRDWCHDGPYNVLSAPIKEIKVKGGILDSKVLDVENLDLNGGSIMEHGPVLVITFTAQQIICVRDQTGKIIEGDPDKVFRVNYVWVLSRDKTELDPKAAWRLLDLSTNCVHQIL